ncbi:Tetraspanin family-domain-containing protein [Cokeromyces recurvatus]|uniref:Tetraspanin family-domain-containing protein n=1 Tax=Cokeromyces recurvatus TaxID=90255 RepID=UPI002220ED0F|nr:Tetraspanin family-domain-containing protein [Cokeromyces recurvatus]KAI7900095.1 Tetraspanin family-domain-containing protein [Cokeromyces recurvatus]
MMDGRLMYKRSQRLREHVSSLHLLIMLIGLVLISIGAYIIDSSNISKTISIGAFIVGGFITFISFIGFFGAYLEDIHLLNVYNIVTALLFVVELVIIRLAYIYKTKLTEYGSQAWDFFITNDSKFIYNFEESLKCCGYNSIKDRAVPDMTCSILLESNVGCKETTITFIQGWQNWIITSLIILIGIQLTILLMTIITTFLIKQDVKKEETYLSLLSPSLQQPYASYYFNNGEEEEIRINNNTSFYRPRTASLPRYGSTILKKSKINPS